MDEIWKDVVGYEGLYDVSNWGRVRSWIDNHGNRRTEPKILKPIPIKTRGGYFTVGLCKNGWQKNFKVHRLVAEAFLPNPLNLPQINHKDECKTNNCVWNLEWCDCKYNQNYGTRNTRVSKAKTNHPSNSKRVMQYDLQGNLVKEWPSAHEVKRQTGFDNSNISDCCLGKCKTFHGFVWRYSESVPSRTVQDTLF